VLTTYAVKATARLNVLLEGSRSVFYAVLCLRTRSFVSYLTIQGHVSRFSLKFVRKVDARISFNGSFLHQVFL